MGLDMYLTRYKKNDQETGESIGYWRKANQIHNWFVENIQNGIDDQQEYDVSEDELKMLLETCREVDAHSILVDDKINDPSVAKEKLPVSEGFFFGTYEYGSYYLQNIRDAIEILERALEDTNFDEESVCYSCWW